MNIEIKPFEGGRYVKEEIFNAVLQRMAKLINDQRTALRSHDKALIEDCKKRENGLLDFAKSYDYQRTGLQQMGLFDEQKGEQKGGE